MASQPPPPPPPQGPGLGMFGARRAPKPPPAPPVEEQQEEGPAQGPAQEQEGAVGPAAPKTGIFGAGRATGSAGAGPSTQDSGFRILKRKLDESDNQGSRAPTRTEDAAIRKVMKEFQTFTTDAASKPRGKDFPRGEAMKAYNAHKVHPFVLTPTKVKKVNGQEPLANPSVVFTDWKTWFNFESQNPSLVLSNGHHQVHLHGALNFFDTRAEGDFVFGKLDIAAKDLSKSNIKARLLEAFHKEVSDEDLQKLFDFAMPRKGDIKIQCGLDLLTFILRSRKKVTVKYTGPQPEPANSMTPNVENLVTMLNTTSPIFTLLRQDRYVLREVDANWCSRIRCVVRKGLGPFYNDIVRQTVDYRFKDWIENPEKPLPHQPWMKKNEKGENDPFDLYAAHPGKTFFADIKEWETILSVALIHEVEYENMCNEATFSHKIEHEAEVIHKRGTYIQMAVSVKRHAKIPTPKFPPGSRFTLSHGTTWKPIQEDAEMKDAAAAKPKAAKKGAAPKPEPRKTTKADGKVKTPGPSKESLADRVVDKPQTQREAKDARKGKPKATKERQGDKEEAEQVKIAEELSAFQLDDKKKNAAPQPPKDAVESATDVEMGDAGANAGPESESDEEETEVLTMDRRQWKAKSIDKDTNRTFVLSFVVEKGEKDQFKVGKVYNITLAMKRNVLPSKRQLAAISQIAAGRENDQAYNTFLRNFILGKKMPQPTGPSPLACLQATDRPTFDSYVKTLSFDKIQQDFYDRVIKTNVNANLLQGPPGCGKTFLDASISISMGIIGKRTGFFCPTNKACEATMDALIAEHSKVVAIDPKRKVEMKIIFFPTSSLFKEQLNSADMDLEVNVRNMVDDADTVSDKADFKPYLLWTHVINHHKVRASPTWEHKGENKESAAWLTTLGRIREEGDLEKKALRSFLQIAWKTSSSVVNDPSVKVIVSTCSNGAALKGMGYQPDMVIIDESAFGTEADSCVPLSLFPEHIILSGDHKQLLPNVKSIYHAEYSNQQGLPVFERVLRNGNVPCSTLRKNHRMNEEIANCPGALTYGHLGCAESTAVEDAVFRYFKNFWNSEDGAEYRHARQPSPFRPKKETKGVTKTNIRRLFFNVKGSRSAHPDNSTSYVNYGNAIAIVQYVCKLLGHQFGMDEETKARCGGLKPSQITIITGYSEQKELIEKLLRLALTCLDWTEFPVVVTIDSIQGGQNDVIALDITAANEHHGAFIGFIGKWNRTNVALTRAKQVLTIFGNLDCWRSELYYIAEIKGHKKFAYLCADVLDGDVVDVVPVSVDVLPATAEEFVTMDVAQWTLNMPHMDPSETKIKKRFQKLVAVYTQSATERSKYEKKLWDNLQDIYKKRDAIKKKLEEDENAIIDVFEDPAGESMDIVLEQVGSGEEKESAEGPSSTRMDSIDGGISLDEEGDEEMLVRPTEEEDDNQEMFFDVEDPALIREQFELEQQRQAAEDHRRHMERQAAEEERLDAMEQDLPFSSLKGKEREGFEPSAGLGGSGSVGAPVEETQQPAPKNFVSAGVYVPPHRQPKRHGDLPDRTLEQEQPEPQQPVDDDEDDDMVDAPANDSQPASTPKSGKKAKSGRKSKKKAKGGAGR